MILLRLISWPYVRKHLLRTMLTAAGIVLGVAVLIGMHSANQSVMGTFRRTVDKIAGSAQIQITAGEPGFDEEILERVQSLAEVRAAAPVIEAVLDSGLPGVGNLMILGVDFTGDRSLRDYDLESGEEAVIDDPLVFLAQPDSLLISDLLAKKASLSVNSRLRMRTMEGDKDFTVRGIMKSTGLASAFGGNLAVMDIYAVQKVFGKGRKFDRIDLAVTESSSVEQVSAKLQAMLGPGFTVDQPSGRGNQFEAMLIAFRISVNLSSGFALLIGMFIIYNAFSIAVTQRRYEIGILRALGATRRQIRTLFLVESALTGLLGSAGGAVLGLLMAKAMGGLMGQLVETIYGAGQPRTELEVQPWVIAAGMTIGVLTSVFAAWVPAREAAAVDPVVALRKGKYHEITASEFRARNAIAAILAVISAACLLLGSVRPVFFFGFFLTMAGAVVLTPTLAMWMTRLLRPWLRLVRPVEGALAADSLLQAPRRTAATVAALMLSLTMVIGFGGMARASYTQITEWLGQTLNPDMFVTTSESISSRTFRFPEAIGEELAGVPGVATVQRVRTPRIIWKGGPITLISVELDSLRKTTRHPAVEGNADEMFRDAAAGKVIIASDNLALQHGLKIGDVIELDTPTGTLRLPLAGSIVDYSDQRGSLYIDRAVFKKYWKDDTVNVFRIYVQPGVSAAAVRQSIIDRMGGRARLFVLSNQEVRDFVLKVTDQWFGMSYVQVLVAVLVAVLGIVNSLTVSITDRRRELGVLQAVGALRNQVRHTVWMEAVAIGLVGVLLGLALGAVYLFYLLDILKQDLTGLRLAYEYPWAITAMLFPVMLGAAFLAAIGPAESAVRGSLVEALEYE